MPRSKIYLPDVNIWLAFAAEAHVHHASAARWMDSLDPGEAAFCRITQMGVLRLLTNSHVMRESVLTQRDAWKVYGELERDERSFFASEPEGLEEAWKSLSRRQAPSGSLWTDCYLMAFADLAGFRIATFDKKLASAHANALLLG